MTIEEEDRTVDQRFTVTEPGRTPGSAEGERDDAAPHDPRHEPGRTPGQAEGERATIEADEQNLEEAPTHKQQRATQSANDQPRTADQPRSAQMRAGQRLNNLNELARWSALIGGGWLALRGVSRSFGSLSLIAIGGGLVYYALDCVWPVRRPKATERK